MCDVSREIDGSLNHALKLWPIDSAYVRDNRRTQHASDLFQSSILPKAYSSEVVRVKLYAGGLSGVFRNCTVDIFHQLTVGLARSRRMLKNQNRTQHRLKTGT